MLHHRSWECSVISLGLNLILMLTLIKTLEWCPSTGFCTSVKEQGAEMSGLLFLLHLYIQPVWRTFFHLFQPQPLTEDESTPHSCKVTHNTVLCVGHTGDVIPDLYCKYNDKKSQKQLKVCLLTFAELSTVSGLNQQHGVCPIVRAIILHLLLAALLICS